MVIRAGDEDGKAFFELPQDFGVLDFACLCGQNKVNYRCPETIIPRSGGTCPPMPCPATIRCVTKPMKSASAHPLLPHGHGRTRFAPPWGVHVSPSLDSRERSFIERAYSSQEYRGSANPARWAGLAYRRAVGPQDAGPLALGMPGRWPSRFRAITPGYPGGR